MDFCSVEDIINNYLILNSIFIIDKIVLYFKLVLKFMNTCLNLKLNLDPVVRIIDIHFNQPDFSFTY